MLLKDVSIIGRTDSYKVGHYPQYPPGTEYIYSYLESRGGKFPYTVFYGLQYIIKEYLTKPVVIEDVYRWEKIYEKHFFNGNIFNKKGWLHLIEKHNGRLPVEIKAVPEGIPVPTRNVLMTIENTDPEFYWLTNYLETILEEVWYPCTVATQSRLIKKNIKDYLINTGCTNIDEQLPFKLHDFGYRGVSSQETAALGGSAHLINFYGTDTVIGMILADEYYGGITGINGIAGHSIPASEHSTITSWMREHEVDAYRNMLEQYPTGLVACVSDSYNIYEAAWKLWGTELKDMVMERDGVLVIRPDSGNPPDIVLKLINILGEYFGYTVNDAGYKVLNPHVRIIQGDGINFESVNEILDNITKKHGIDIPGNGNVAGKWAAENISFGSGGALLQKMNRDTQKFAFKCSHAVVNGKGRDVYKNPITDPGKVSKKGKLKLSIDASGNYVTLQSNNNADDYLKTVYKNGYIVKEYTFDEVRKNAEL